MPTVGYHGAGECYLLLATNNRNGRVTTVSAITKKEKISIQQKTLQFSTLVHPRVLLFIKGVP